MYLAAMGVKGVTIERLRGRGEVEGESQTTELTEGARLSGKGK